MPPRSGEPEEKQFHRAQSRVLCKESKVAACPTEQEMRRRLQRSWSHSGSRVIVRVLMLVKMCFPPRRHVLACADSCIKCKGSYVPVCTQCHGWQGKSPGAAPCGAASELPLGALLHHTIQQRQERTNRGNAFKVLGGANRGSTFQSLQRNKQAIFVHLDRPSQDEASRLAKSKKSDPKELPAEFCKLTQARPMTRRRCHKHTTQKPERLHGHQYLHSSPCGMMKGGTIRCKAPQ